MSPNAFVIYQKNMFMSSVFRKIIETLLAAVILVCGIFIISQFTLLHSETDEETLKNQDKKYNILVVGQNSFSFLLKQVLAGAETQSIIDNAAIELYTGSSSAQEISMQALFNYASYLDADGIIAYINGEEHFELPKNASEKNIPLVTIGTYLPTLPQISYIGINYSELGKIFAREIISSAGKSGKVIILDSASKNNPNYSTLMNGLVNALSIHPEITLKTLLFERDSSFSKEDNLRQQLASEEQLETIVSLTEQNTILAAQSIRDLNLSGKVRLIGFGDSDECLYYFEKSIVTELVSVKTEDIGKKAMQVLSEYISLGYANSFVTVDIEVLRNEK